MMKKSGLTVHTIVEPAANPLCDWAVHLYRHPRTQYISQLFPALHEHHIDAGLEEAFECFIAPRTGEVIWSKVGSRSVTGSMNEMIYYAKWLLDEDNLSLTALNRHLNENILSYIQYQKPLEAHRKLASLRTV